METFFPNPDTPVPWQFEKMAIFAAKLGEIFLFDSNLILQIFSTIVFTHSTDSKDCAEIENICKTSSSDIPPNSWV